MPRKFLAFSMLGACLVSVPADAEEPTEERPSKELPTAPPPGAYAPEEVRPAAEVKAAAAPQSPWQTEVHGYFRAPMALGISSRPNPDQLGNSDPAAGPIT